MTSGSIILIYMTCANHAEASRIAAILVEEGLAACVNILPPMVSHYMWEGQQRQSTEIPVFAKTTSDKFAPIEARVTELHSYDVPCIIMLKPDAVAAPYAQWLHSIVN
jgi:periplasmic divalent cation tolerance protein